MSLQLDPWPTFTQCRRCPGERDFDIRFEKHTDNVFEEWITLWIVSVGITSRMWRKQKESDYFDSESFESDPDLQRCCHRVKIAYATPTSTPLSVESLLKVTKIKVCWIASNVPIRKIHSWYDFQVLAHPQKLALCELLLKMQWLIVSWLVLSMRWSKQVYV